MNHIKKYILGIMFFFYGIMFVVQPLFAQDAVPTETEVTSETDLEPLEITQDQSQIAERDPARAAYDQALLSYNLAYEQYRTSRDQYILKRGQYLRFKTLTARDEAFDATRKMLTDRDEVIIKYMDVLDKRLNSLEGLDFNEKNLLLSQIADEKSWYENHKNFVPSAGSLEDLIKDSDIAKKQFELTKQIASQVIFHVAYGRIADLNYRTRLAYDDLKAFTDTVRNNPDEANKISFSRQQTVDRFLVDSENRLSRAQDQITSVKQSYDEQVRRSGTRDISKVTTTGINSLQTAQQYIREVNSFLKEIVRILKVKDVQ